MDLVAQFIDIIFHLDVHLAAWSSSLGVWMYVLLFLILFAETGLVVTPFLPGDSLLFAVGALTAIEGSGLNIYLLIPLLMFGVFLGDNVNYRIGHIFGEKMFTNDKSLFFKRKNLDKTHEFYEKYGALTVIIARFMPFVRTFAPFVAGVGSMNYFRYLAYSLVGSAIWINSFLWAGYYFGNLPQVKNNFHYVIFGVIFLSILPMIIGAAKKYFFSNKTGNVLS